MNRSWKSVLVSLLVMTGIVRAQEARKVTSTSVTVRGGPAASFSAVGTAHSGETYVAYSKSGSWVQVFWSHNKGWLPASSTTVVAATGVEILSATANVFGSGTTVVGQAPSGNVYVLAETSGGYRKVWYGGALRRVAVAATRAYPLSSGSWNSPKGIGVIGAISQPVRTAPSDSAPVITQVHAFERYVWTESQGPYKRIWLAGHTTGWIKTDAASLYSEVPMSSYGRINWFWAPVYSGPEATAPALGHLHSGQYFVWTHASTDDRVEIYYNGQTGWVPDAALGWSVRTERVTLGVFQDGPANAGGVACAISGDGRYVAFQTQASNLVPPDYNSGSDVFVFDRRKGVTKQISGFSSNEDGINEWNQSPAISANGRFVAFVHDYSIVLVYDLETGLSSPAGVAWNGGALNGEFRDPSISADGRYVAFASSSTVLVPGLTTAKFRIYIRDRLLGTTEHVSKADGGGDGNGTDCGAPSISANGRWVAYQSDSSNLTAGDTNSAGDVFRWDRVTGTTVRASIAATGAEGSKSSGQPSTSADGRYIAFTSSADNLVPDDSNGVADVFVRDLLLGTTQRISDPSVGAYGGFPSLYSHNAQISGNGRYVAYYTEGADPANPSKADLFVHDRVTGTRTKETVRSNGGTTSAGCYPPAISNDGRYVVFQSEQFDLSTPKSFYSPPVTTWTHAFVRKRW